MYRVTDEINCMMCGTQIGEVRDGRFTHHRGCSRPVEVRGGFPRCCRCGGSLYMERVDNLILRDGHGLLQWDENRLLG